MASGPHLLSCRKWDTPSPTPAVVLRFLFCDSLSPGLFMMVLLWLPGFSFPGFTSLSALHDPGTEHSPLLLISPKSQAQRHWPKWNWHCTRVNTWQLSNKCLCPKGPAIQNFSLILLLCGWLPLVCPHPPPPYTQTFHHISAFRFPRFLPKSPQGSSVLLTVIQSQLVFTHYWLWVSLWICRLIKILLPPLQFY